MADCLHSLRHYRVVSRNDDDCKVSHLRTTGTHSREGFVTRSVEEGNAASIRQFHIVGTDMLGDTTCLSCNHIGLSDVVQQGSLTVVHVAHHRNHRRSWHEILLCVGIFRFNGLRKIGGHELHFISELLCHKHESLGIQPLVDGHHKSQAHTSSNHLGHRGIVHKGGKVVHSHELSDLEHLLVHLHLLHLLLHPVCDGLSLLPSPLGSETALLLVLVHPGVGLLDLLLDFLLHLLSFSLGHSRTELLLVAVASALSCVVSIA